jgi:hypothetical protein
MDEEGIVSVAFEGFPGVARPRRRVPVERRENRRETRPRVFPESGMPWVFPVARTARGARVARK